MIISMRVRPCPTLEPDIELEVERLLTALSEEGGVQMSLRHKEWAQTQPSLA